MAFTLLCALSGSVDWVSGFRAGWGLGTALFISTALATIVDAVLLGRRVLAHIDDPGGGAGEDAEAILLGDAA